MEQTEADQHDDILRIPVVEEDISVAINRQRVARVRVETRTDLKEEWVKAELTHTDVDVTKVPIGREIKEPPAIRVEGQTTIIPVLEERIVVEKKLFLKEELHVTRKTVVEAVSEPVHLREQHVSVERIEENKEN